MDKGMRPNRPDRDAPGATQSSAGWENPDVAAHVSESSGTSFYALFESARDAIFLLDGEKFIDCNARTLEMFGCGRAQIIDQPFQHFSPLRLPEGSGTTGGKLQQKINTALGGAAQFFEGKLVKRDKSLFDAEISFNGFELNGKRLLHCIMRDVTERKREEELYKTLTTSSPVGIYIIHGGKFRFANPRVQEFVGYSARELLEMPSISLIHPDDRAAARENAIKMLKKQRTAPYEFRIVTKGGQIKWTMEKIIPIYYDGRQEILGSYMDIDDRKRADEILRASEERYRTILENIEDGYYEMDLKGRLTFFNESCRRIFGYSREELLGMKTLQYVNGDTAGKLNRLARKVYETGQPEKGSDLEVIRKDGFKRHIEVSVSLVKDAGKPVGFRGIVRDIDDRKKAEATILHMAYHDALTGLPNRVLFNDRLNVAIAAAQRHGKRFGVMMLDLDQFKNINDSLGHDVGDQLLQSVGNRLRGLLRKSDTVARMGGDEFMLLLPEINQKADVEAVAKKILASFQREFVLAFREVKITTSIGIAVYPEGGREFDTLKKNADIAMYKAKEKGRNNFQS